MLLWGVDAFAACPCPPQPSLREEFQHSGDVFLGRVSTVDDRVVQFDVILSWKGVVSDRTSITVAACSYPFEAGGTYLVYATNGSVSTCSRTRPSWQAYLDDFDSLKAPIKKPPPPISMRQLAPIKPCPTHADALDLGTTALATNLTLAARAEYPGWLTQHAPWAAMPLDSGLASDSVRPRMAFVCRDCRKAALDWITWNSIGSTGPETDWELPPPGTKAVRHEMEEYRRKYSRESFAIVFQDHRVHFDSRQRYLLRQPLGDFGGSMNLTEAELDRIYEASVRSGLFDVPQRHPDYPANTANARVHVGRYRLLFLRCGDQYRTYSWYDERAPRNPAPDSDWGRIFAVYEEARRVMNAHEER